MPGNQIRRAVKMPDGNGQPRFAGGKALLLAHPRMGDVAKRAMHRPAKLADHVAEFANDAAVGVVDAGESKDACGFGHGQRTTP